MLRSEFHGSSGSERQRQRGVSTLQAGRSGVPHFSRVLPITLGMAVCALLVHMFFLLVVRPSPQTYSLDAITSALGSGIPIRALEVQLAAAPPALQQDERDRAVGLALADRLSVAPSAVRVVLAKPSSRGDREGSGASERMGVTAETRHAVAAMGEMSDQIVGDFTAAVRLEDGRWRVVRPAP